MYAMVCDLLSQNCSLKAETRLDCIYFNNYCVCVCVCGVCVGGGGGGGGG